MDKKIIEFDPPKVKTLIPISEAADKFTLILEEEILKKIEYLCKKIPNNEWSGVLFYKYDGSIKDITNLKITPVDVYPLDIGTSVFTTFDYSPDLAFHMASNPELLDCRMALIHSHQNMSVYFSGTDTATLQEQAPEYNIFLSVIVNNKLDVEAALAVYTTQEVVKKVKSSYPELNYSTQDNIEHTVSYTENVATVYKCNIIKADINTIDTSFIGIVDNLLKDESKHSFRTKSTPILNTPKQTYLPFAPFIDDVTTTNIPNDPLEDFIVDLSLASSPLEYLSTLINYLYKTNYDIVNKQQLMYTLNAIATNPNIKDFNYKELGNKLKTVDKVLQKEVELEFSLEEVISEIIDYLTELETIVDTRDVSYDILLTLIDTCIEMQDYYDLNRIDYGFRRNF